jgi:hypothetical protein
MLASKTVKDHLEYLLTGLSGRKRPPRWPPDVFAIVASLLHTTGGYCVAAMYWPPSSNSSSWVSKIHRIARTWRTNFNSAPLEVQRWWAELLTKKNLALEEVARDTRLCNALLQLLAAADQASAGAGIPALPGELDAFDFKAGSLLSSSDNGSSLCEEIVGSTIRVLPKTHVPQSGFTLRSFSHHLCLAMGNEIRPFWYTVGASSETKNLKILLVPWPKRIGESDFRAVKKTRCVMRNLPSEFGFFEYQHVNSASFVRDVLNAFQKACKLCGKVDVVVMPECSISDLEYDEINATLLPQGAYLIAGIAGGKNADGTRGNYVRYNIPSFGHHVPIRQGKHHRWKLDAGQIETYRLQLNRKRLWWEHTPIADRSLNFVSLSPWLSMCVLICEDLARPDPVGDLIRAVGPNLVIALLLDGPQLEGRWPGRYAATLADDPGCSVLTLTSSGMARLSRPPWLKGAKLHQETIALWKDVRGKPQSISLQGREAAVLHITIEEREEWTADGRSDMGSTGYPQLQKVSLFGNGKKLKEYDV